MADLFDKFKEAADPGMWISHETISRTIDVSGRRELGAKRPSTLGLDAASGGLGKRSGPTVAAPYGT